MIDFLTAVRKWLVLLIVLLMLPLAACGGSEPEGMQTGAAAPDFSLPDVTGQTVSLSDYAGTPVLLFFHMAVG